MATPTSRVSSESDVFWKAVVDRDRRFDGVLYYAVITTGVFCRPGCPSRRPRPENVMYFRAPEEARRQGFRPCKRCRPEAATVDTGHEGDRDRVLAACRAIESAEDGVPTLSALASRIGLTPDQTRQVFRRTLGISHKQYADAIRLARFKRSVRAGGSVAGATYEAGFGSSSRLYERAAERLGMTPGTYGRRGRGQTLEFWIWPSPLGSVLVAATAKGLCSVKLGSSERDLERELREEFANATVTRSRRDSDPWVDSLRAYLAGLGPIDDELPTDVAATAFQARVWSALRSIPLGETRTYAELADSIGQPRAVRAVASACARNPVALVVPCHRVVPKGAGVDAPGGYRWGSERKARLLELEQGLRIHRGRVPESADE